MGIRVLIAVGSSLRMEEIIVIFVLENAILYGILKKVIYQMKKEGDRKICEYCKAQGITIEIHCAKIMFKGEEKLSWRNPDGSAHFDYNPDIDGYEHVPTRRTMEDVRFMELEDRVDRIEKLVGIVRVE